MKKLFAILLFPGAVFAQVPQRPSDIAINGRMEAQASALNAVVNDCAVRTGGLYEALEKASREIERLRNELEAAKKKN